MTEKPKLTITITGPMRSGKTSLVQYIKYKLMNEGVDVHVDDIDGPLPPLIAQRNLDDLIEKGLSVELKVVQTHKGQPSG